MFLERQIQLFGSFAPAMQWLDTVTGVARRSAAQILAELGDDMTRFFTAAHATS